MERHGHVSPHIGVVIACESSGDILKVRKCFVLLR